MEGTPGIYQDTLYHMAKKIIQPDDREIGNRARQMARQLKGRVFAGRAGIYIVRGMPEFEKLYYSLKNLRKPPGPEEAPTPVDLGFPSSQISRVSRKGLASRGRALQKWRSILQDYDQPRKKKSRDRERYRRWRGEIDEISLVLENLWNILRQRERSGAIPDFPYILPVQSGAIVCGKQGLTEQPIWEWLHRLVAWIAGERAAERFFESVSPLLDYSAGVVERDALKHAISKLQALDRQEQAPVSPGAAAAVREVVEKLPDSILDSEIIELPRRPRDIVIGRVIESCRKALKRFTPPPSLISAAAALCATDGASSPLPHLLLLPGGHDYIRQRKRVIFDFYSERSKPGYQLLLKSFNDMSGIFPCIFGRHVDVPIVRTLRLLLAAGADTGDIVWIIRRFSSVEFPSLTQVHNLGAAGLSPDGLRMLVEGLEEAGLREEDGGELDLYVIVNRMITRGSSDVVDALAEWVVMMNPEAFRPDLAAWCWRCLDQIIILESSDRRFRAKLRNWVHTPSEGEMKGIPDDISGEVSFWLGKLASYQQMCGQEPRPTGTLKKLLFRRRKISRQIDYLNSIKGTEEFNHKLEARLRSLEDSLQSNDRPGEGRLIRKVQEICARTALEALNHTASIESRRIWKSSQIVQGQA